MGGMSALRKSKTLRYGVPMLLLIIGGSFGLREFAQIRYDAHKLHSKLAPMLFLRVLFPRSVGCSRTREMDPALEERIKKNKVTLESEYEKMKEAAFDDWKNIRGPRPWEDSKSFQEQQR